MPQRRRERERTSDKAKSTLLGTIEDVKLVVGGVKICLRKQGKISWNDYQVVL